jgi:hypothetical protein
MLFLDHLYNASERQEVLHRYVGFAGLMSLSAAGGRVAGYRNWVGQRQ